MLDEADEMILERLFLLSVTHRTAPVAVRERLAFDAAERAALAEDLRAVADEVVALVTCNRTELYCLGRDADARAGALTRLAARAGLPEPELVPHATCLTGAEAARHLFRVAAGLDSLIIGEPQILGQVRDAAERARLDGTDGPILARLCNYAIVAGKRARSETPISRGAGSVSHAAVELAREILGDLEGRRAVVIGLGEMGQLVARNLAAHGVSELVICNRTPERAAAVAEELGGRMVPWPELDTALGSTDIAITATGSREPVLTPSRMEPVAEARSGRPLLLIDIAVPRDIAPEVATLPGMHVRDIDALHDLTSDNLREREAAIPQVEAIIEEQVAAFKAWCRERELVPVIRDLHEQAAAIRAQEIERALRRLRHLSERDQEVVRALAVGLTNKLLHTPVAQLKALDGAERDAHAQALIELFDLEPTAAGTDPN